MTEKEKKKIFIMSRKKQSRVERPKLKPGADKGLKRIFADIGVPEKAPFSPDPFQVKAIAAVEKADCLVTAPTGSGKTWIAEQAIAKIRETGGKAWYASPLKALSNSKYYEFCELFGAEKVGILTGDRKENPDAPIIVGTTEILRNQLYDAMHYGETFATDFVVLDEAHFLGDADRGVVWEEIMIYLPERIPMLMLSATIGNARQIAEWLAFIRSKPCTVVEEKKRPVPLYSLFLHPSGTLFPLLSPKGRKGLHHKVLSYLDSKHPPVFGPAQHLPPMGEILQVLRKYDLLPAIFFLKSRADCDHALNLCEDNFINDLHRKDMIRDQIEDVIAKCPHVAKHRQRWQLEHLAVGAHHSGQLPAWKLLLEQLMTQGALDAIFATSTVAAGVNFPARTIVFLNSDRFNGVEFMPLTSTEFHQMTGRAGRRGMDQIGFAMAIPGKYMDISMISELVSSPPSDVLSQIRINFSMVLNLLLSHTPDRIEDLLKKSFAAYLIAKNPPKRGGKAVLSQSHRGLTQEFRRHLNFLKETGYVTEDGKLTEDGVWTSQLRVDQPLLIAEGFRQNVFPKDNPALLAAIITAFVNERESDDRIAKELIPPELSKSFATMRQGLKEFIKLSILRKFTVRPFFFRPALAVYTWAKGEEDWEKTVQLSELDEGNLAMLILRTADNLRHIRNLSEVFPDAANTANEAIRLILRDPVISEYDG